VPDTNISTNLGGVGVLSGGWGFGNGLRAELEFDYRYNGLDRVHTPIGSASLKGSEQKFGPMVNVFYDFTKYNQGLSVRRAQAVAAELVKDGVPRNAISIQGFGETHLLVQTDDNVRKPQNRRVEILIK
jgi:OOP family OmpA-OmpF porin